MFKKLFHRDKKPEFIGVRPESREADYPFPEASESPPFKGKYAVLNYYIPSGLMHPEDIDKYVSGERGGESVYYCINENFDWVTIINNMGYSYRVNPMRVLWVPEPEFDLNQEVETKNGTLRKGRIKSRVWHYKERCFTYYIEIVGKKGNWITHKRRYWNYDLKSVVN